MVMNISRTTMMVLLFAVAVTIAYSFEMLQESKTHELHPDLIKSDHDLYNVSSDCDPNILTSGYDLDILKPDRDLGTVTSDRGVVNSDCNLDIVNSDCDLDIVNSDRDLAIVLGRNTDDVLYPDLNIAVIQAIDLEGTSDIDIESRHDEQTKTEENIYTEQINTCDPPHHSNSHTAIRDVAKYPGLFHTPETMGRMNKEMDTLRATKSDNDNCCPTVIKHVKNKTMRNADGLIRTLTHFTNSSQAIPFVDNCDPHRGHGRRGRCKTCEAQNVTLFLLVEPDSEHSERYFDKFSIPMYCTCKSLICK
ncbi:uncharacterized protein LOC110463729 [Mizuhopecten yessoensis]|uniref:Spaetzle domain-containing protein n=1 Tax=Mizuhopecten yessoensis TaxID=6573 RepID=A0A210PVF1_MIZYE|nr:uncharacterized protein LOC110463729 [Mizuhopecten yessoensis]OWF40468.1 hypothetical protein KP79_PYT19008 [Mizuhopecten yessoensis]